MDARRSSTSLPPARRLRRRDWMRDIARVLCVLLALVGLIPVGVGLLVRTSWARGIATARTRAEVTNLGIDARYELELRLWPLSVAVRNVRVQATDGGAPFLTARRISARPKIFALLSKKLLIDQIEIEEPSVRVVVRDGKVQNLHLDLPKKSDEPKTKDKPPFSVISATGADIDLSVDENHLRVKDLDADITVDADDAGKPAFELALRIGELHSHVVRSLAADEGHKADDFASYEDVLCQVDARARFESKKFLVRRFSAHGALDLENEPGTSIDCDLPRDDKRTVELELGHLAATPPDIVPNEPTIDVLGLEFRPGVPKRIDGHVHVRVPLAAINRIPGAPDVDGWLMVDVEARYAPDTLLPDMTGRVEGRGFRVDRYSFARSIKSDFSVHRGIVTTPLVQVEIGDGLAEIHDIELSPLSKDLTIKVGRLEAHDVNFTSLMHDLSVARKPHVAWDLKDVLATQIHGTLNPLHLDGDLNAHTTNFAVYDDAVVSPTKTRAIGVAFGDIRGKLAVRPLALEFHNTTVTTPHSVVSNVLVSLGFNEVLRVEVPTSKIDLADLSPIGSVSMGGVAEAKVNIAGGFGDPHIEGDVQITNYTLGDKPNEITFGNVTQGHIAVEHVKNKIVTLGDVRAQKGKSTYEMTTGRLEFGGEAGLRMDSQAASKNLDLRDFLSMFKLDEDPRFAELGGNLETNARIHLVLGGPEDRCGGGTIDVQAQTTAHDLNLLGEKFDEGHADFEYRWIDRMAGIEGADIDVRSLSLAKVKKAGRPPVGSVLGGISIHRGGELRGSLVLQGFPLGRTNMLGAFAPSLEGAASGIARLGGTISAFEVQADVDVTPMRVLGAPFGGSNLHLLMTQKAPNTKVIGKTACGAPISAPFDKEAYLRDTSVQGEYRVDGSLFGGQVNVDNLVVTRQKAPVITGHVDLARFDLGPVGKILFPPDETLPSTSPPLGGEISGDVVLERVATDDLAHAKGRFTPRGIRVTRGNQRLELRTTPFATTPGSQAPIASLMPPIVIALADDEVTIPPVTFDLAAPNGFKGAFSAQGNVKRVTQGGELAIDAQLSPIDLGILVGVVPRMTRAVGKLSGSVKLTGKASQPDFDGQLKVRGGEFAFSGLPSALTDVEVDVRADENEVRVTRAVGHFLGGDVSATARMPLKDGQIGVAEATVTGRQLYVAPVEGVKSTVDADLVVTVNPFATTDGGRLPLVGGDVTVTSFDYTRPFTLDLSGLRGGARRTSVEAYDPALDSVNLGFNVHSRVPLRIKNNLVDAQLQMDPRGLSVSGTNQRLGLRGQLNAIPGGRFRVFANDFEVQKATIRFDDPTRIAPNVDIVAVTEYRRYGNTAGGTAGPTAGAGATGAPIAGSSAGIWRITLHAYGDLDDLRIDMTSDPALSSEDIALLLTIGLTRAEVDQVKGSSAYTGAAFEALGTFSGVDRAVKQVLPVIDDFRPGSAYSSRTGRIEPNITVGRRIAENVRLQVTSGLAEDPQLRALIEWRLTRSFTVEPSYDRINTATSSDVGNIGADLRWRISFD